MKKLWLSCLITAILGCLILQIFFLKNPLASSEIPQETSEQTELLSVTIPYESMEEQQEMQQLAQEFMQQNPDIKIILRFYPYAEYWKSLYLDYSQQSISDLMIMNTSMIPAIQNLNILCKMDTYLKSNGLYAVFPNKLLDGVTIDGNFYGVPFSCYTYALYCNTDILNKHHCTPPETWEEFYYVCEEISTEPAASFAIAAAPSEELTNQFLQFLYANNTTVRNLKSSNGIDTFKLFADLSEKRLISKDCVNWNQNDLAQKFINQEVSMMVNSSAQLPALLEKELPFQWTAVSVPTAGPAQSLFSERCISVTKDANWKLSTRFLEFLISKQAVSNRAELLGSLPVRSDVSSEFFSSSSSHSIFLEQFYSAQPLPSSRLWQNISLTFQDALIETIQMQKTPEQIAQETYQLVNYYIIEGY